MAEEKLSLSATEYEIGYHNNGEVMVLTIPLKEWAKDVKYGDIKISGVFTKAERIALKNLQLMRSEAAEKKIQVAQPGTVPMPMGRG